MYKNIAFLTILALLVGILFSLGFAKASTTSTLGEPTPVIVDIDVFKDRETGCQYLTQGYGITPRLNSAGIPMCKGTGL